MRRFAILCLLLTGGCSAPADRPVTRTRYCQQYGHLYRGIPGDLNYCAR